MFIGYFMYMSFAAAVPVFCSTVFCIHFVPLATPSLPSETKWINFVPVGGGGGRMALPPSSLYLAPHFVQNKLEINSEVKSA